MSLKKGPITAILTLTYNVTLIDGDAHEWIDAKEHSLASLAKVIGLDENHKIRTKITFELTEEPCIICQTPATGDKICQNCGKPICDQHARIDTAGTRYCPICYIAHAAQNTEEKITTRDK